MNYRHIFHAGNFADVFKHWILTLVLEKLVEKPAPFCIIDTHAGLGMYDLKDANARKTLEYATGVQLFLESNVDPSFQSYYKIVNEFKKEFDLYPGSPAIISEFLRSNDRLWCAELHPEDYLVLQQNFRNDKRIKTLHQDGYTTLKALLPPNERRGLIFIDPPFEQKNEVEQLIESLKEGLKRFAHGIYAIWYPIKDKNLVNKFYRDLIDLSITDSFYVELHANTVVSNQLSSCGMVIINPPWKLKEKLKDKMPLLLKYLHMDQGKFRIQELT